MNDSSDDNKSRFQLNRRRRKAIAATLAGVLLLVVITCTKILVRTGLHPESQGDGKSGPGTLTAEHYEMLGYVAARSFAAPAENPIAAERHRDVRLLTRIAKRSKKKLFVAHRENDQDQSDAVVHRQPFVLYVAIAAIVHFLMGFVGAMQLGYRPFLFGVRVSLRDLDPFPNSASDGLGDLGPIKSQAKKLEDLLQAAEEEAVLASAEDSEEENLEASEEASGETDTADACSTSDGAIVEKDEESNRDA